MIRLNFTLRLSADTAVHADDTALQSHCQVCQVGCADLSQLQAFQFEIMTPG